MFKRLDKCRDNVFMGRILSILKMLAFPKLIYGFLTESLPSFSLELERLF